jgi:nucleotide-binding universal stress UspA family protein
MTLVLGWEAAEHGVDDDAAVRLAAVLAAAGGSAVLVTSVLPPVPEAPIASRVDQEYRRWRDEVTATRQAEAAATLRAAGVADVRTAVVQATSVPAGLVEAVRQEQAELLVLGAATASPAGRFAAGSVAERLLHSSPVPLALAPRECPELTAPARLTCAWAGTARSREALAFTRSLAAAWGGVPIRLVTFVPERAAMLPSETGLRMEQVVSEEWASQVRGSLEEAVTGWTGPGPAPGTVLARGAGWAGAVAAAPWAPGDLLVVGSSRLGPLARVFVGSTATKILRAAPVPVVVVPRGAGGTPSPT